LARVKAHRQAQAQCRQLLIAGASALRWADGAKSVDTELASGLEASIFDLATDYGTDGSVVVEMALPLDALRAQVYGPDALQSAATKGPAALIIDARKIGVKPALGYLLTDRSADYRGPTLFFTSEEEARKHLGVGKDAPLLAAVAGSKVDRKRGAIVLNIDELPTLLAAQPLVAILWTEAK
jgi:hypothetical protein